MSLPQLDNNINALLQEGTVIPAHPLALTANRTLDEENQRRLTRYYIDCGVGGLAVGVHTTQFQIRKPGVDLLEPVLRIAADEIDRSKLNQSLIKVAGIVGPPEQAVAEALLAKRIGYHLGLLSMGGLSKLTEQELLDRAYRVAEIIPLFGFYLQPAVGGRILSFSFYHFSYTQGIPCRLYQSPLFAREIVVHSDQDTRCLSANLVFLELHVYPQCSLEMSSAHQIQPHSYR